MISSPIGFDLRFIGNPFNHVPAGGKTEALARHPGWRRLSAW
jgi:hypothetical protein